MNLDQLAGLSGIFVALVAIGCWLRSAATTRRLRRERRALAWTVRLQRAALDQAHQDHFVKWATGPVTETGGDQC